MDIGDIFSDSLGYPSKNLKRVAVLGISFLFSILIIPLLIVIGYALRVIGKSVEGEAEPPAFDELGTMIVDGLKYLVAVIGYFLIPGILMVMGIMPVIASITAGDMMSGGASVIALLTGSGLFLLGVLLAIVISVIANMGIANMAHTGELGAAFRFGEILRIIGSIGWGRYIIWYIVLTIIAMLFSVVGTLIALIPILGFIVYLLLIAPYALIFQCRAIGLIYREGI
ncbi:MAG: hypothetical protein C4B59_02455 [Candidatus Methanogaster sp.]|uniref:Uncharacterized protein n=1 Tax=Candidatus Methanogaster sp. TaxID=3386292 RepID=A0AC61L5H0_9EURY|nr:MAG: hypothetical protein C4B59_02455 [ANME-2 cluster archaeon]